jgi:predicted MPP superfamily phosphohydrolase
MPENINLEPIFSFIKDLNPAYIILGGDVIDAAGMFNSESMQASQINLDWYERDVKLLQDFFKRLKSLAPKAQVVFLEGNHEERWRRVVRKYPKVFGKTINLKRDAVPKGMNIKWIEYGSYNSFYKLGDTIFIHGTVWPDAHAKKYAMDHTPYKCIYGHLHHFQSYTTRKAFSTMTPRYAVTAGCLSHTTPEWKAGAPNQWVNGFISFMYDNGSVIPSVHVIEKGKFHIGAKEYK